MFSISISGEYSIQLEYMLRGAVVLRAVQTQRPVVPMTRADSASDVEPQSFSEP